MTASKYKIIGPTGEGPYEAIGETPRDAIIDLQVSGKLLGYSLETPRGVHGGVIGYVQFGNAASKVGAFDVTWLGPA